MDYLETDRSVDAYSSPIGSSPGNSLLAQAGVLVALCGGRSYRDDDSTHSFAVSPLPSLTVPFELFDGRTACLGSYDEAEIVRGMES